MAAVWDLVVISLPLESSWALPDTNGQNFDVGPTFHPKLWKEVIPFNKFSR